MRRCMLIVIIAVLAMIGALQPVAASPPTASVTPCQTFRTSGKTLCGRFLTYWQQHNGLARFGYPVSNPFAEKSAQDGKTRTVQYFQWARLTAYPANTPPKDIGVTWLRRGEFLRRYPTGEPDAPYTENLPRLPDARNVVVGQGDGYDHILTYVTKAKPSEVRAFYQDVLGKNGWSLVQSANANSLEFIYGTKPPPIAPGVAPDAPLPDIQVLLGVISSTQTHVTVSETDV